MNISNLLLAYYNEDRDSNDMSEIVNGFVFSVPNSLSPHAQFRPINSGTDIARRPFGADPSRLLNISPAPIPCVFAINAVP